MTPGAPMRVARAAAALARAELRVRRRPTGALVAPERRAVAGPIAAPEVELRVRRTAAALRRAARLLPWRSSCLVRALALADLLAREGVPDSLIRLGVRRDGAAIDAHAWVELDGRVVGDDPDVVRRFAPLGAVTPASGA